MAGNCSPKENNVFRVALSGLFFYWPVSSTAARIKTPNHQLKAVRDFGCRKYFLLCRIVHRVKRMKSSKITRTVLLSLLAGVVLIAALAGAYEASVVQLGSRSRLLPFLIASLRKPSKIMVHAKMLFPTAPVIPPEGVVSLDHVAMENVRMLNAERSARGLLPLDIHSGLTELAGEKARELISLGEVAPYSQTIVTEDVITSYVQPAPAMVAESAWSLSTTYDFFRLGVYSFDHLTFDFAARAHNELMRYPEDRQNMLDHHFSHVGVAVVGGLIAGETESDDQYWVVLVQIFMRASPGTAVKPDMI